MAEPIDRATPLAWPPVPSVHRLDVNGVAKPATRDVSAVTGSPGRHSVAARFWFRAPTPAVPGKLGTARSVDAGCCTPVRWTTGCSTLWAASVVTLVTTPAWCPCGAEDAVI